jgi:hypothetical protein
MIPITLTNHCSYTDDVNALSMAFFGLEWIAHFYSNRTLTGGPRVNIDATGKLEVLEKGVLAFDGTDIKN